MNKKILIDTFGTRFIDTPVKHNDLDQIDLAIIRDRILTHNERLEIRNEERLADGRWNRIAIVIQVHNRLDLLRELLLSVIEMADSDQSLVIVSMDTQNQQIIDEIEKFNHCATMIIYHPYSMQFYLDQYPATDLHDCTRDQKQNLDKCNKEAQADSFGHFREAKFSQIKLHWLWKLNFIYDRIKNYDIDAIVLLEEDHYLAPDALHIAKNIILPNIRSCEKESKICLGALGTYMKANQKFPNDALTQTLWVSGSHNMGMVVTRKWYNEVKKNSFSFCVHDDYNWDFSLMKISKGHNWQVFLPTRPRVFHLGGDCGYHAKKQTCNIQSIKTVVRNTINQWTNLFPPSLTIKSLRKNFPSAFKAYGGWGDVRDRRLCLWVFSEDRDGPLANL